MSYNVRGLRHGVTSVHETIMRSGPDIVLIQESGPRHRFRKLARRLGMQAASDNLSPFRRRIKNAVFVRPPIRIISSRLERLSYRELFYPRGVLICGVAVESTSLTVASVHLGTRRRDRREHAKELTHLLGGVTPPLVAGGDLNDPPDGPVSRRLGRYFTDLWAAAGSGNGHTIYAWDRRLRIDYLFGSSSVFATRSWVADDDSALSSSDHLPVVADIGIRSEEPRTSLTADAEGPSLDQFAQVSIARRHGESEAP
jgi:endonuclease/exonuclease/phosphatase family metal-dependent hydrolase